MFYLDGAPVKPKANHHTLVKADVTVDLEKDQSPLLDLDYRTWLPYSAKTYKISPHIEDYILVITPICPSDIPNRNGIGFPLNELVAFQPPPMNRQVYAAWKGCPVHLEHDNEVHERAYGVILDTKFTPITGYGKSKLWKVMGLLAIDKNKNPDIAQKVLNKEINTYSMGALVEGFSCSYCGTQVQRINGRLFHCNHISGDPQRVDWKLIQDAKGSHVAYKRAHNITPIECSIVGSPAWSPALSDEVFTL